MYECQTLSEHHVKLSLMLIAWWWVQKVLNNHAILLHSMAMPSYLIKAPPHTETDINGWIHQSWLIADINMGVGLDNMSVCEIWMQAWLKCWSDFGFEIKKLIKELLSRSSLTSCVFVWMSFLRWLSNSKWMHLWQKPAVSCSFPPPPLLFHLQLPHPLIIISTSTSQQSGNNIIRYETLGSICLHIEQNGLINNVGQKMWGVKSISI